ncbi:MAG TPA: ATP cone domain-containing protein, partial [Candidatus Cloacimonadota bacterium]|nr:ATP cone domain-containing protein [Candidatus Cloacimonadota bacterium]
MMFHYIRKRNQQLEKFDKEKITQAMAKAGEATGEFGRETSEKLTLRVLNLAQQAIEKELPDVEEIQDIVEDVLLASPYLKTAKAYIIYRDQHSKMREVVSSANVNMIDQYLQKLDW